MPLIVGPVLPLLKSIGLQGPSLVIATAFYSRRPLEWLAEEATADEVTFLGRLDLRDATEVERGFVDPAALLAFSRAVLDRGGRIRILVSPGAHAKMYVGDRGVIVGSANLSVKGFGAGPEIVNLLGANAIKHAMAVVERYSHALQNLEVDDLERYVKRHRRQIQRGRRRRENEEVLPSPRMSIRISPPSTARGRPARSIRGRAASLIGDYEDFLRWATRQRSEAAHEIVERAHGKGQLSGHIHRNFYGLRQFLLANPDMVVRFAGEDPDTYSLARDPATERRIARFVSRNATDEPDFVLDYWETYLPRESGGRAAKHGGTIGNLNKMLPLLARYLTGRMSRI